MPRRILLAAVAGLGLALCFEPVALPWLLPFCVAGLVLATRGLRARRAWLPGLAFGVAFYFVLAVWMRTVGTDAWIGMSTFMALYYAALGSAMAVLHRHRLWPLWIAAAWVAADVSRSSWPFSGMPWGNLSFGVIDTPAARSLPYVGATGLSLLLALLGCLVAGVVLERGRARRLVGGALVALVVALALPVAFPWTPSTSGTVTVAAVQGDVPGPGNDILFDFRQVTQNQVDATVDLADRVADGSAARPDLVVWPENSTAVDPFADQRTNTAIRTASAAIGVPILVGAIVDGGEDHVLNQGIVWDPQTGAGDRYTKRHPVVFGEYIPFRRYLDNLQIGRLTMVGRDMLQGTRKEPLGVGGVLVADAICFDIAYDDGLYDQVSRGAELLTVQTSNATFINTHQIDQQFAITRLRAIETGRAVVVASTNGISGVVAPDGTVLARAQARTQDVLLERVDLVTGVTPAVRLGAWPGRLCLLLTVVGLLLAVPYRRWPGVGEAQPAPATAGVTASPETVSEEPA